MKLGPIGYFYIVHNYCSATSPSFIPVDGVKLIEQIDCWQRNLGREQIYVNGGTRCVNRWKEMEWVWTLGRPFRIGGAAHTRVMARNMNTSCKKYAKILLLLVIYLSYTYLWYHNY